MDCSLPGSSVHGIFQARVLERGAIAFSTHIHFGPSLTWPLVVLRAWTPHPMLMYKLLKTIDQHLHYWYLEMSKLCRRKPSLSFKVTESIFIFVSSPECLTSAIWVTVPQQMNEWMSQVNGEVNRWMMDAYYSSGGWMERWRKEKRREELMYWWMDGWWVENGWVNKWMMKKWIDSRVYD